jgi:hypothetical protein
VASLQGEEPLAVELAAPVELPDGAPEPSPRAGEPPLVELAAPVELPDGAPGPSLQPVGELPRDGRLAAVADEPAVLDEEPFRDEPPGEPAEQDAPQREPDDFPE